MVYAVVLSHKSF